MLKISRRMDWLEEQIEIQENALIRSSEREVRVHAFLLEKLTEEWTKRTKRGEVSARTVLECEG